MKWNKLIPVLILSAVLAFAAYAATNMVGMGDTVSLTWSLVTPTAGDAVVKCTAKSTGGIIGVSLDGTAAASETSLVATRGIFDLAVTASSTVGSIVVGDYIFASVTDGNTCTTILSNVNTGLLFGQALEAVTASTTAGVYSTINVKLLQPSHL